MHAIEVADQGDEEAAEFRFAAVKGMVTAHTHTMRATKGESKESKESNKEKGESGEKR